MFSLNLESKQPERDLLIAELFEANCTGITELSDTHLRAFFDDSDQAHAAGIRFGGTPEPAEYRDWVAESQSNFGPQLVGERFFLVPQWLDDATPPGRLRIAVNNGLAFGTGKHESTRLCLMLLERLVQPGLTVLDIGTGSGILSEAAQMLGAAHVFACDIDHTAVEIASRSGIHAFTGSAEAVRSQSADLLVANISPEAITAMGDHVQRILKPGGVAILSGLELRDVVPFQPAEVHTEGNWKALVVHHQP